MHNTFSISRHNNVSFLYSFYIYLNNLNLHHHHHHLLLLLLLLLQTSLIRTLFNMKNEAIWWDSRADVFTHLLFLSYFISTTASPFLIFEVFKTDE